MVSMNASYLLPHMDVGALGPWPSDRMGTGAEDKHLGLKGLVSCHPGCLFDFRFPESRRNMTVLLMSTQNSRPNVVAPLCVICAQLHLSNGFDSTVIPAGVRFVHVLGIVYLSWENG